MKYFAMAFGITLAIGIFAGCAGLIFWAKSQEGLEIAKQKAKAEAAEKFREEVKFFLGPNWAEKPLEKTITFNLPGPKDGQPQEVYIPLFPGASGEYEVKNWRNFEFVAPDCPDTWPNWVKSYRFTTTTGCRMGIRAMSDNDLDLTINFKPDPLPPNWVFIPIGSKKSFSAKDGAEAMRLIDLKKDLDWELYLLPLHPDGTPFSRQDLDRKAPNDFPSVYVNAEFPDSEKKAKAFDWPKEGIVLQISSGQLPQGAVIYAISSRPVQIWAGLKIKVPEPK